MGPEVMYWVMKQRNFPLSIEIFLCATRTNQWVGEVMKLSTL